MISKIIHIAEKQGLTPQELLCKLYIRENLSRKDLAQKLNFTVAGIKYLLKQYRVIKLKRNWHQKGRTSSGWKRKQDGVRIIRINGKSVLEHRYIMEQHLDRKLGRYEVVHHKNKNRSDNRIENLMVLTLSRHSTIHATGVCRKGQKHSYQRKKH